MNVSVELDNYNRKLQINDELFSDFGCWKITNLSHDKGVLNLVLLRNLSSKVERKILSNIDKIGVGENMNLEIKCCLSLNNGEFKEVFFPNATIDVSDKSVATVTSTAIKGSKLGKTTVVVDWIDGEMKLEIPIEVVEKNIKQEIKIFHSDVLKFDEIKDIYFIKAGLGFGKLEFFEYLKGEKQPTKFNIIVGGNPTKGSYELSDFTANSLKIRCNYPDAHSILKLKIRSQNMGLEKEIKIHLRNMF